MVDPKFLPAQNNEDTLLPKVKHKKEEMEEEFRQKFVNGENTQVRKYFLHELYHQYHGAGQHHHHHLNDEGEDDCENQHDIQDCDFKLMRSENLGEELGSGYCAHTSTKA